jgi:hypothetical protein
MQENILGLERKVRALEPGPEERSFLPGRAVQTDAFQER